MTAATMMLLLGGTAAADGYSRGSVKDAPVHRWGGWYGGLHVGYIQSNSDTSLVGDTFGGILLPVAPGVPLSSSSDQAGFIGGGQVGFNVQSGTFVWGIEADISRTTIDDREIQRTLAGFDNTIDSKLEWFGTARLRGGVLLNPTTLVYVTGGLAFARVEHSWSTDVTPALLLGNLWQGRSSNWETGWTIGAGAEFALSRNVTLRGEYLYYDLGNTRFNAPVTVGLIPLPGNVIVEAENTGHIGRAAVNFKF
jgi:outer membrane immunogenic protein